MCLCVGGRGGSKICQFLGDYIYLQALKCVKFNVHRHFKKSHLFFFPDFICKAVEPQRANSHTLVVASVFEVIKDAMSYLSVSHLLSLCTVKGECRCIYVAVYTDSMSPLARSVRWRNG